MSIAAQAILKKALMKLTAKRVALDREIRRVKAALRALGVSSPELAGRRHRKNMTLAERRSVSRRMKAYWAKRRRARKTSR